MKAFNALAPGGYLELQDARFPIGYIGDPPVDSHIYKWTQMMVEAAEMSGRPVTNAQHYKRWLEEIGFEDVVEKIVYWPWGTWPKGEYYKKIGAMFLEDLLESIEGLGAKLLAVRGLKIEDMKDFVAGVKNDMRDPNIHSYMPL